MRAVLIATGEAPGMAPLTDRQPVELVPVVNRPFLQHVVEHLTAQGVTQFDVVLSHFPEKIERLLGDGKRWGCKFTFHLARDPARPYRLLKTLDFPPTQHLLLGHADRLPRLPLAETRPEPDEGPRLFSCGDPDSPSAGGQWTGWAWVPPRLLAALPAEADEAALERHLLEATGGAGEILVPPPLSVRTFADCLAAHKAILDKRFEGLLLGGQEVEPGVWLSRNVQLHPTRIIHPPVYIGEDCRLGPGSQVGPHAVICNGCVLDGHCTVADAAVFPGSYVGEGNELDGVIVDKNLLIHVRVGVAVRVTDDFLLASLEKSEFGPWLMGILSQLAALLLLVPAAPFLLLTSVILQLTRKGPLTVGEEVVRLPAVGEERQWQTYRLWGFAPWAGPGRPAPATWADFFQRFLPGLVQVALGRLRFVGVPPRTAAAIRALPADWRKLYLHSKAGIVTEADVFHGPDIPAEERYVAEAYYAGAAGFAHDWKLLLTYLRTVAFGRRAYGAEE